MHVLLAVKAVECYNINLYQVEVLNKLVVEDVLSFMTYLLLNLVSYINILSPMFTAALYTKIEHVSLKMSNLIEELHSGISARASL